MNMRVLDAASDEMGQVSPEATESSLAPALRETDVPKEARRSTELVNPAWLKGWHVAVVMPAYNEAKHIETAIRGLPVFVRTIIVVDDASTDGTAEIVTRCAERDERIVLLRHERNRGVGGAMKTGYEVALARGADIVVKMDADGQMSAEDLPELLYPLVSNQADYSKGNRFRDFAALRKMPAIRRMGNAALSFLAKAAVGYWSCFDPCNGYVAIRAEVLRKLPIDRISQSYFFETSMLANLNLLGAVVKDVDMPARYGDEASHLSIRWTLLEFPARLLACFLRRILLKDFLYDFSIISVYLLTGLPLMLSGILYGGLSWRFYHQAGTGAPTGTVVIPTLLIILGFQLLLSAVNEDIRRTPTVPLVQKHMMPQDFPRRAEGIKPQNTSDGLA